MRYTSRPPPSYEPVEVTVHRSEAQPAAEGRLKTLALALDLVGWADLGSRGRVGVAAGPAWLHSTGKAQDLVYTEYLVNARLNPSFFRAALAVALRF